MKGNSQSNKTVKIIVNILSVVLIAIGAFILVQRFVLPQEEETQITQAQEIPEPPQVEEIQQRTLQIDQAGVNITRQLKRYGFNMGFVWSSFIKDLGFEYPIDIEQEFRETNDESEFDKLGIPQPLEEIVPAPQNPVFRNKFVWEQYEIDAPIIYASFEDVFQRDEEGALLFDKYVDNNPVDSPVQTKLRDGIVHLPFTPSPGEVGNSYIIGHSSNYSSVESDYNFVFAPIIETVTNGEEFVIYDNLGRELTFEVIDTKVVREEEVAEAYVKFEDKRTVTLQGSILEQTPQGILPTKRYLVIGELVTPETNNLEEEIDATIDQPDTTENENLDI